MNSYYKEPIHQKTKEEIEEEIKVNEWLKDHSYVKRIIEKINLNQCVYLGKIRPKSLVPAIEKALLQISYGRIEECEADGYGYKYRLLQPPKEPDEQKE